MSSDPGLTLRGLHRFGLGPRPGDLARIGGNIREVLRAEIAGKQVASIAGLSFASIREAAPNVPITLWCNEDTPLIWAQIIRDLAGLEHGEKITGGFDLLSDIMSREGMRRFRAYLHEHQGMTEMQKRRVIAAFLDKFALEDALEEELDIPGWTDELVEELTEIYDEDVFHIQRMPGVQMITP